jgi:hypothetical protein
MGYGTIVSREYTPIPSVETCPPYPGRIVLSAIALSDPDLPHVIRRPKLMPRYYFHFQDGSSRFEDGIGEVFPDASSALRQARRIALELAPGRRAHAYNDHRNRRRLATFRGSVAGT